MGCSGKEENLSFKIKLLLNVIDMEVYPFTKKVLDLGLSEQEYQEVIDLVKQLNETFHNQLEEGLIEFESLLVQFVGMLNDKLEPEETLHALKKEGYYPSLMDTLVNIHNRIKDN